jgi:hypothetical protein
MKLLTFRRLKIKPAAESKNFLPQARTRWTRMNKQQIGPTVDTKDLTTCVSTGGQCKWVYIGGTFSPTSSCLLGLKHQPVVPVRATTRDKRPVGPLVPVGGSNWDWKTTFSPGLNQKPGLKIPVAKACFTIRCTGDSSPGWWFQPWLNLLLLLGQILAETKSKNGKSVLY